MSKTYSQDIISGTNYDEYVATTQAFYEIRNADSKLVAFFGIGTHPYWGNHNITASIDSGGIEILDGSSGSLNASMEFI
ncbi:hypothetical protein [Synechococcus sp. MIT S9503]|uniref:hypothetical protein n=1 Tax=Synechococcus sp. MIT S9503 TaxID=3082547 RepID=UPI0039A54C0F